MIADEIGKHPLTNLVTKMTQQFMLTHTAFLHFNFDLGQKFPKLGK